MKNINGEKVFCLEYDKETLHDMIDELNERIYKAIEYIHLYTTQRKYFISYSDELKNEKPTFNGDVRKLLDILKGDSDE